MIDYEIIGSFCIEINDRFKKIMEYIPVDEENESILKNLAACSIHLAMFSKDLVYRFNKIKPSEETPDYIKKFLYECGCKGK